MDYSDDEDSTFDQAKIDKLKKLEEAKKRLERYKIVKNKNENNVEKQGLTKEELRKV